MNVKDVIKTITIRAKAEGVAEATQALKGMQSAQEGLATTSDTSAKRQLSMADAVSKAERRFSVALRTQQDYEKLQNQMNRAVAQNPELQERANSVLGMARQHYDQVTAAASRNLSVTQTHTNAVGLQRHELINLSRQFQDVGVALQAGQNPLTILVQQGSQIADVFAASRGSVSGFFGQAVAGATRFAASAAGVVTGITAIGGAALFMAANFTQAQKEIDRALSGIGAASGMTRGGVNRIAEQASSPFGLSVSEAREAATAFAATGKIYETNVRSATLITKQFALAMGIDAADATKQLAKDLSGDLVGAALKWDATLGFADGKTIDYIQSLVSMGNRQGAINALITAAAPAIGRAAEQTSIWAKAWTAVSNAASNTADVVGRATARGLENLTGADLGGFSNEERLANLREQRASRGGGQMAQSRPDRDLPSLRALDQQIAAVEKRMADLAKQSEAVRFAQLSIDAREFGRSLDQTQVQIEKVSEGLANIARFQAARINQGLGADAALERQAQLGNVLLAQLMQQQDAEQRKAQFASETALKYKGVSTEVAVQLRVMQAQLGVAQAVTGAQQIQAQHHATIVTLLAQGKTLTEATAIADAQRAISIAQVNVQAEQQLKSLQQQGELLNASSDYEKDRIKAAQDYQNLLDQHVDSLTAQKIVSQQLANSASERRAQEERAEQSAQQAQQAQQQAAQANNQAIAQYNAELARAEAAAAAIRQEWQNIFGITVDIADDLSLIVQGIPQFKTWVDAAGQRVQFNPEGYASTTTFGQQLQLSNEMMKKALGSGNFQEVTGGLGFTQVRPTEDYLKKIATPENVTPNWDALNVSGGVGSTFQSMLSQGFAGFKQGTDALNRVLGVAPETEKMGLLQSYIASVQQQPATLEREELLKQLTDQMKQLSDSTNSLNSTMQNALSPYYSQDPRTTKLGFRAGVVGNPDWMAAGASNDNPVAAVTGWTGDAQYKGFAAGGSFTVPGGYSTTDNKLVSFAARSGETVSIGESEGKSVTIDNRVIIQGNVDGASVDKLKRTQYQQAQRLRSMMAA